MKNFFIIIHMLALLLSAACTTFNRNEPRQSLLDDGWQFRLNGDTAWVAVDLPHDWSIECDFDSLAPAGNDGGYLPTGKGEYRRNLHIDSKDDSKLYGLILEGAYMDSKVYVNGHAAGGWPYGYTTYTVDLTPYVKTGDNQLIITIDNSQQKNSRWYSGSGIYRHVWLTVTHKTSVPHGGIAITTPVVSDDSATVCVNVTVANQKYESKNTTAKLKITCDGKLVASQRSPVKWTSDSTGTAEAVFEIKNPKLWSPEQPNMYQLTVILKDNGEVIDVTCQKFGIREFAYSADKGLTLNGKELILNGGCVHHDNGILGAASYDAAEARKVALMKQAGFNAVRTSHNPPAAIMLTVDRDTIQANNQDLSYVVAQLVDADGTPVPDYDMNIGFDVQGAGTMLAAGSADATDNTGYRRGFARTSNGRAVAIVKSGHKPGNITLNASANDLPQSITHITSL